MWPIWDVVVGLCNVVLQFLKVDKTVKSPRTKNLDCIIFQLPAKVDRRRGETRGFKGMMPAVM